MIAGERLVVCGGGDDGGSDGWLLYGLVMGVFDAFANLYYCSRERARRRIFRICCF